MANDGFNGSTVLFNSVTLGSLRGISWSNTAGEVDITASGDTVATCVAAIPKAEITVDFVGGPPTIAIGSTAALTVTWFDSATLGTLTKAILLSLDCKGNMNGEITSTAKFAASV